MKLFKQLNEWFSFRWPFNRQQWYNRDWPWSRRQTYTRDIYTTTQMYNSPRVESRDINGLSYSPEPQVEKMLNVVLPSACRAVTLTLVMDMEGEPERQGGGKKKKAKAIDHPQPYTQSWMETRCIQELQSEDESWPEQTVKRKKQNKRNTKPHVDKTLAQEETEIEREHKKQGKREKKEVRANDHPQSYTQSWIDTSDIQDSQSEDENWPEQTVKRKKQKKRITEPQVDKTLVETIDREHKRQGERKKKKVRENDHPQPYTQSCMETRDIQDLQSEDEICPEQTVKRKVQKKVRANEDPQPYTQSWMDTDYIQDLQSKVESWPDSGQITKIQKKRNTEPQVDKTLTKVKTIEGEHKRQEERKKKKVRINEHPQFYTQSCMNTGHILDLKSEDKRLPKQIKSILKKRNTEPEEDKTLAQIETIEEEHKRQEKGQKKNVTKNDHPQPWIDTDIQDLETEEKSRPEQTAKSSILVEDILEELLKPYPLSENTVSCRADREST